MKSVSINALLLTIWIAGGAASANAAVTVSSDLNSATNNENYTFENNSIATGSFVDWIAFSFDGVRDLTATISGSSTSIFLITGFDLYYADQVSFVKAGSRFNPLPTAGFASLNQDGLGPGTYWIKITGTNTLTSTYTGTIALAGPIPEPSTYGMLGFGMALIGFSANRRSKSAT